MSDDQYPRRRVLHKQIIGLFCCHFVVHLAWEVQENGRAGARYTGWWFGTFFIFPYVGNIWEQ
jgi:hypothetical protein